MAHPEEETSLKHKQSLLKASALAVFILLAVVVVRYTPVGDYLEPEALRNFLRTAGFWAPLLYIIIYAVGGSLFVPATLLTALGGAMFGPYEGFIYAWTGGMFGAGLAFWIGRTLGRDFVASLVGNRLKKYDDAVERNGFATVLYLRLIYFPFAPTNYGMGLTRVRFWDYIAGTGLGTIVNTFITTFFVGTLKEVWASGDWYELISFKFFVSLGLFLFSFTIPKIIKKLRGEN